MTQTVVVEHGDGRGQTIITYNDKCEQVGYENRRWHGNENYSTLQTYNEKGKLLSENTVIFIKK